MLFRALIRLAVVFPSLRRSATRSYRQSVPRPRRRARVAVEPVEVRGAEEVEEAAGGNRRKRNLSRTWSLARCDSLYAEGVAARPRHVVFHFAVRANGLPVDLLSEPGGSNDPHSAPTVFATEDFLHSPSSR